jgi:hypothetical protein
MKGPDMKKIAVLLVALLAGGTAFADNDSVVDRAGKGIKKGGNAAAHGIDKGARKVEPVIRRGGNAAAKGVKKGGKWVGRGLHKAGEKVEKVSK